MMNNNAFQKPVEAPPSDAGSLPYDEADAAMEQAVDGLKIAAFDPFLFDDDESTVVFESSIFAKPPSDLPVVDKGTNTDTPTTRRPRCSFKRHVLLTIFLVFLVLCIVPVAAVVLLLVHGPENANNTKDPPVSASIVPAAQPVQTTTVNTTTTTTTTSTMGDDLDWEDVFQDDEVIGMSIEWQQDGNGN
jgi:hypothetical protein